MIKVYFILTAFVWSGSVLAQRHHHYPDSSNFTFQVVQGDRAHNDYNDHYSEDLYRVRYLGNHWYEDERYYYYYDDFDKAVYQMNFRR